MDGEPKHSHLDQQRRPPGGCPGCDADWERQRIHVADVNRRRTLTQQLERMADKPKAHPIDFCKAIKVLPSPANMHTCLRPAGHTIPHLCPLCDREW